MGAPDTGEARKLGYRLRSWTNRTVGGLRLASEGKSRNGIRCRVRAVRQPADPRT